MIFGKSAAKDQLGSQYIPFTLGLPRAGPPSYVEFMILGKNEGDNQNRVLKLIISQKARLVSYFSCPANHDHSLFSISCTVDKSEMDRDATDLLISIRKLGFIVRADKASMHNKIFSNFAFPVKLMGKNSSIVFDAASLFEILETPSEAEENGRKYAANVVEAMRHASSYVYSRTKREEQESLVHSIQSYIQACGWGLLDFDFEAKYQNSLYNVSSVAIRDLPKLSGNQELEFSPTAPWVTFLRGLVSGFLETLDPDIEGEKIVGESFNKYDRTLTFFVSHQSDRETLEAGSRAQETKVSSNCDPDEVKPAAFVISPVINNRSESRSGDNGYPNIPANFAPPDQRMSADGQTVSMVRSERPNLQNSKIVTRILSAAKNGSTKIDIMNKAKLRFAERNQYLELLLDSELLEMKESDDGSEATLFQTTPKGSDYLNLHTRLNQNPDDWPAPRVVHNAHPSGTNEQPIAKSPPQQKSRPAVVSEEEFSPCFDDQESRW